MSTIKLFLVRFYKDNKFIILAFLIWKISLTLLVFLLQYFVQFHPTYPYSEILVSTYRHFFIYVWGGFDGVHYLNISENGYTQQYTQAFFPIFPILIKVFSFGIIPKLFVGVAINNIGFFFSLIILKKIIKVWFPKIKYQFIVLLYLSFPTSFFFNAVYNEGLFLCLSLLSFYFCYGRKYLYSSIAGAFSTGVRLIGIFILPALLIFTFLENFKKLKVNTLWLLLIPTGLLLYMIYLQIEFNDYLYFLHAQNYFGNSRSSDFVLLPQVIYRYLKILTSVMPNTSTYTISFIEVLSAATFITLPVVYFRKISKSWLFYSLSIVVIPSMTGTFSSVPRYVLMSFPVFFIIASAKPKFFYIIIALSLVTQLFLLSLFASGIFVS